MITAEEFLKDLQFEYEETGEYKMYFAIDIPNKLREFAKLHVTKALKHASIKASASSVTPVCGGTPIFRKVKVDGSSIINAYLLKNIK